LNNFIGYFADSRLPTTTVVQSPTHLMPLISYRYLTLKFTILCRISASGTTAHSVILFSCAG